MKTAISYRHLDFPDPIEAVVNRRVPKLEKLLKHFSPDLVLLRGAFEKHPHRTEFAFAVNLFLPTGTLHAASQGPDPRVSVREAFEELESQVKKHEVRLRGRSEWDRKNKRSAKPLD